MAILNLLEKADAVSLESLMEAVDASESTLRRDIVELASMKKLRKVRGGVAAVKRELAESRLVTPSYFVARDKNLTAKQAIGKAAGRLLEGVEGIIINGGTTTWQLAEHLPQSGLTIYTNSLPLIEYVSTRTSNRCFVGGGEVFHHHMIILGHLQSEASNFFGDIFFTGCQGVSPWGIMEGDPLLVHAEQQLINQCEKLVVMVDSTKFTKRKSIIMCPLERVDILITDDGIDNGSLEMLEDAGVEVIIAPREREAKVPGTRSLCVPRCLALDFGASSGRLVSVSIEDDGLHLDELARMENGPEPSADGLVWPHERLFRETMEGLRKAGESGLQYDSIGVDTWGVDYVLLDDEGELIGSPVSYRDNRTEGMVERFIAGEMSKEDVYARTGIQFLPFNTIFQLYSQTISSPETLAVAKQLLFTADYYHYLLSGEMSVEKTNASTSQMWNLSEQRWDRKLLSSLALPSEALQTPVAPGTVLGELRPELAEETGLHGLKVVAPASHDTASAVLAVPAVKGSGEWAYLSSGTWSLLGIEVDAPITDADAMAANWTNETGFNDTIRFLKNITGMWIVQQVAKEYDGRYSFAELAGMAEDETGFVSLVDPDDSAFFSPVSMIGAIREYCAKTFQPVPETPGALTRCAYDSLSLLYRKTMQDLCELSGREISLLHVVGGGAQATLLNRLTAGVLGMPVVAGPVEATVIGNALAQFFASGVLSSLEEARALVARSYDLQRFEPEPIPGADAAYQRFLALLAQK